jgi:NAD(P)-dependent dehydrogenase (short-subunit alcohol dehydrogenase family)
MDLAGRRALVTGGGGGLGAVIAAALAARGAHVIAADADPEAARRVAATLEGSAVHADLSSDDGVEAIAAATDDLDVLVNCAGGWGSAPARYPEADPAQWDAVLTLNLRSPMRLLQHFRPALARSPIGAAVNISSSAGIDTTAYESPEYGVAKAGLIRLTTAIQDWPGVRVSCIVPGWIGLPRAHEEIQRLPPERRPRLIPPQHIAETVLELIDDPASAGRVVVIPDA